MNQQYHTNATYEILTPNGWEDFEGIFCNKSANKSSRKIIFTDRTSITATDEHRFFINAIETSVKNLQIGDCLDSVDGPLEIL
jgi:hypothetical protein